MAQTLSVIRADNFSKGYNDSLKPELLTKDFCADALNCWVNSWGISKRNGYSLAGDDVEVEKPILSLAPTKPGGTDYLHRARNIADGTKSTIEYWDGTGDWTAVTGATTQTVNKDHWFITAKDVLYIGNDTDDVLKSTNGTSTAVVADFPTGVDARWFHNYMFVVTAAGRLYWSNLNDPETWTADDYIDINPNDGDEVVGLGILKDELFIFKKNRIWALTGYGASDFTVDDMGERLTGIGTQSKKSIVEASNDIYFLAHSGDIPHFTSIVRTRYGQIVAGSVISDEIEGSMKRMVKSKLGNCAGVFDGRRIWWSVTTSGSTNNEVFVYDEPTKGWTRHTGINASCWVVSPIVGNKKVYFGESGNNALVYVLDSSTSDNGTAIDMQFKTPMYNPFPEAKCKWKYLQIACDVSSDATLDIDYSRDGFEFSDLDELNLTGSSGVLPFTLDSGRLGTATILRKRIDWAGGNTHKIQYLFRNNTATDNVTIREYQLMYKPRGLKAVDEA
jgi:hypothetical protein